MVLREYIKNGRSIVCLVSFLCLAKESFFTAFWTEESVRYEIVQYQLIETYFMKKCISTFWWSPVSESFNLVKAESDNKSFSKLSFSEALDSP